jgi:hypothetical protein
MSSDFLFFIPLIPTLTYGSLLIWFHPYLHQYLSVEERNINSYRSIYLTMVALIFAGLVAIAVADPLLTQDLQYAMYFSVIAFLSYLIASMILSYTFKRWQNQFSEIISETGSLSLILSVIALVSALYPGFFIITLVLGLTGWLVNHAIQWRLMRRYFVALELNNHK